MNDLFHRCGITNSSPLPYQTRYMRIRLSRLILSVNECVARQLGQHKPSDGLRHVQKEHTYHSVKLLVSSINDGVRRLRRAQPPRGIVSD